MPPSESTLTIAVINQDLIECGVHPFLLTPTLSREFLLELRWLAAGKVRPCVLNEIASKPASYDVKVLAAIRGENLVVVKTAYLVSFRAFFKKLKVKILFPIDPHRKVKVSHRDVHTWQPYAY